MVNTDPEINLSGDVSKVAMFYIGWTVDTAVTFPPLITELSFKTLLFVANPSSLSGETDCYGLNGLTPVFKYCLYSSSLAFLFFSALDSGGLRLGGSLSV